MPLGKSGSNITPTAETVTANLSSTSITIPSTFVGISLENAGVIQTSELQGTSGTSLAAIVGLFGPNGSVRIGGSSADSFTTAPALTPTIASAIETFLTTLGSGWSLIYNLDYNVPSTQVTQAGYIISAVGVNNVIFQIGNEEGTSGGYATNWNSAYATLKASYPTMKFSGPDCSSGCYDTPIENWINLTTATMSGLALCTYHLYFEALTYVTPATAIADSLGPGNVGGDLTTFAGGRIRVTESNIGGGGSGYQTVSDRLIAATWYLNSAVAFAEGGYQGINIHGGLGGDPINTCGSSYPYMQATSWFGCANGSFSPYNYNPVDFTWTPAAEFYGMLLFSKMEGQTIASTTNSGTGNVKSMATVGPNGNANILVINNDPKYPVTVTPAQSVSGWSAAKVWNVGSASDNWCFDNVATLNGVPLNESAANMPMAQTISNGGTVTIVPCGAAVIEIQP
jgi:hypothetical protein